MVLFPSTRQQDGCGPHRTASLAPADTPSWPPLLVVGVMYTLIIDNNNKNQLLIDNKCN